MIRFLIKTDALEEAFQACQKSLRYNARKELIINEDASSLVAVVQLTKFLNSSQLLKTLEKMLKIVELNYKKSKDKKWLYMGRNITKATQEYQEQIIKGFSSESDKLEIYRQSNYGISKALKIAAQLYKLEPSEKYLDEVLRLAEYSKFLLA